MDDYKFHVIYKTTNIANNKIYIGLHSTNKLEDGYLGSGWILKDAIKKYGKPMFKREILCVFSTREEAREMEALVVDQGFVSRSDTYNLHLGGMGVEDQWGEKNPMYGKIAPNSKKVRATHKDGTIVEADSLDKLAKIIKIDRANIRNLIKKGIVGRRGWRVELVKI